jgi:WhiB family redox-sensing transcriptional regulator
MTRKIRVPHEGEVRVADPTRWDWTTDRACNEDDQHLFFGPDGETKAERSTREAEAKDICSMCPLPTREACLDMALGAKLDAGVWGGLGEEERVRERRRRMRRGELAPVAFDGMRVDVHRKPQAEIDCGCGCDRRGRTAGIGPDGIRLVNTCWRRWVTAGKPQVVPPPPGRGFRTSAA